jgi:hypothetical protein
MQCDRVSRKEIEEKSYPVDLMTAQLPEGTSNGNFFSRSSITVGMMNIGRFGSMEQKAIIMPIAFYTEYLRISEIPLSLKDIT